MKKIYMFLCIVSLPTYAAVSANVSFASDYIWRGMTQTDGPAISGGFDFAAENGFYAGIWGSNVNFNDEGTGSELDYYFGYSFDLNALNVDVGYLAYDFPKNKSNLDLEELVLSLGIADFGFVYASGQDGAPDYTEISYPIGPISFSYGHYDDYGNNLLISYGFACGNYDCSLAYSDFSEDGYGADEDALVFSITASF
tara:strand:- start:40 stop:633 length:594 start_codon:yes stop_codon:yes gene_type:complete